MKKIKLWIPIILIGLFFVALVVFRPLLLDAISKSQKKHLSEKQTTSVEDTVHKRYNYHSKGESYTYTFLEFGSTGCSACKQMESVMEKIKLMYHTKVNVVFVNVTQKENKELVQYYGIATIPTQVLLDKSGKEYFRHSGYLSETDLAAQFK